MSKTIFWIEIILKFSFLESSEYDVWKWLEISNGFLLGG